MRVAFRLVDVFTDRPFAGNQLCVVPEPGPLDDATMQSLAREIGFSETTFVTETGADRYRMRIFTPDKELPFAGHPTLGTAYVMVAEGRVSTPLIQTVTAGDVPVEIDLDAGGGRMRQLPPEFGNEFDDRDLVARASGLTADDLHPDLPMQVVSTGLGPLIVPIRDLSTLRRAVRDQRLVAEACERAGGEELYLFAIERDGEVTARMFDPNLSIGEDPATGSAAGPLGAYLAARAVAGMPGRVRVQQGAQVDRPSVLEVEVHENAGQLAVFVGGSVQIVGEGSFVVGERG
ncbi:MAG: PhzF family phenazine biosynthesis protein [Actinomycetota bacterium]